MRLTILSILSRRRLSNLFYSPTTAQDTCCGGGLLRGAFFVAGCQSASFEQRRNITDDLVHVPYEPMSEGIQGKNGHPTTLCQIITDVVKGDVPERKRLMQRENNVTYKPCYANWRKDEYRGSTGIS